MLTRLCLQPTFLAWLVSEGAEDSTWGPNEGCWYLMERSWGGRVVCFFLKCVCVYTYTYTYVRTRTYMHVYPLKSQDSILQTFYFKSELQPTALVKQGLEVCSPQDSSWHVFWRPLSLLPPHLLACQDEDMCFGNLLNHFVKSLPIFWFWTISLQWLVTIY